MPESKTSSRRVQVALRRAKVLKMRAAGATHDEILAAFPDDYRTRAAVIQDVQRALLQTVGEPAAELRALEASRLDMLWIKAMEILQRTHVMVSNGRVVMIEVDGKEQPIPDDGPALAAIRELRQLSESRRKLHGLDAPSVVQVMSDDLIDAEIRRLTEELDRAAALEAAGTEPAEEEEARA